RGTICRVKLKSTLALAVVVVASHGCVSPQAPPPATPSSAERQPSRTCDAAREAKRFMQVHKDPLKAVDRIAGFITTPLKYLSTAIDGPGAWEPTGCYASGTGRPLWRAQHSTDDLYTVDVELSSAEVNGVPVPSGRYVRLEVKPGTPAHEIGRAHV